MHYGRWHATLLALIVSSLTLCLSPQHWWDLCAGPHVSKTSDINTDALELETVAGAYWRGDEKRQMLQRIYGTVWETPEQLGEWGMGAAEVCETLEQLGWVSQIADIYQPSIDRLQVPTVPLSRHPAYYLHVKEEAKKRDHRKLGQELSLFSIQETAGGGLVFWHPKGAMVRHVIESFWKDVHLRRGYQLVYTPHVAKVDLWKTSG